MKRKETKSLISNLRNSGWSKFCLFLLVGNFINLSANFYEGNIVPTDKISMDDPIDTLTELIYEWVMDGDGDIFPDNGTEQDDNSVKKIKLALLEIPGFKLSSVLIIESTVDFSTDENLISGYFSSDSPPPDYC
ncbi:hypothetical protein [Algoriphagus sp.]|uniref:hypothetical protein n=1 Tax=Algoriphagus sp. TaxID=1872435 RepID=UPI0039196268